VKLDGFIEAEEATAHSVKRCCELFQVSKSAYYQRRKEIPSARAISDAELLEKIAEVHSRSKGTYGSPRVHRELLARGVTHWSPAYP
jgi:putative transposase